LVARVGALLGFVNLVLSMVGNRILPRANPHLPFTNTETLPQGRAGCILAPQFSLVSNPKEKPRAPRGFSQCNNLN
jgi:hypothetical protein